MYYVLNDHLGSLAGVINAETDEVSYFSYDAWGNPRDNDDWTSKVSSELFADRGFTGHEHLQEFGLIDMNGRVYDPILGRFLSPDPYVQMPGYANNFNRYAYCLNNPLVYTDPDGEMVWLIFAIYGAWQMGVKAGIVAESRGDNFWKDGFWKGAVVGFATGALGGSGIAPLETEWIGTTLWGAGLGAASHAGTIWARGGNDYSKIWQGALIGGAMGFIASEQFGNWAKEKGFKNNQTVFEDFRSGMYTKDGGTWQQDYLEYRGFEGRYIDEEGMSSFRTKDSEIIYRKGSFNEIEDVESSYLKESFHAHRFNKNGREGFELGNEGTFGIDRWPEERVGAIHVYRNQGLIGPGDYFSAIKECEKWINSFNLYGEYNPPYLFKPFQQRWWHRIYKIQRLW